MTDAPLRLVFNVTGHLREAAKECEADVFLAWFGNTRAQLDEEYSQYDRDSLFLAVFDEHDTAVGAMRLILPTHGRLKTLDDVARPPWRIDGRRSAAAAGIDPATTWDLATIGVREGRTGPGLMVAAALYHAVFLAYRVNGFRSVVAIVDEQVRALGEAIGLRLHPLPGTFTGEYLGSPESTPVYGVCTQMLDTQRRESPDGYRLLVHGIGLEGITMPDPETLRVAPPQPTSLVDLTDASVETMRSTSRWN